MDDIRHIDAHRSDDVVAGTGIAAGDRDGARSVEEGAPGRELARDAALDAARATLLDLGWRRTTLTEVARRAGISRMSIYRAWPDRETLLGDLLTREAAGLLGVLRDEDTGRAAATPARIAADLRALLGALRANELFSRVLQLDPEIVLPYLFQRRGRTQDLIAELLGTEIADGQRAGVVRRGEPIALARAVLLTAHGFALSASTMIDADVDQACLDDALERAVVGLLAPTDTAGRSGR
ncbi:TetR/AcrR family transcriptional regulator [Nocardioides sp.]|uniref:TetR/AcrR family transcriptional regulator n=1 Tax=Nocardioides sp. TaxID=35761 RepID=UPI003517CC16